MPRNGAAVRILQGQRRDRKRSRRYGAVVGDGDRPWGLDFQQRIFEILRRALLLLPYIGVVVSIVRLDGRRTIPERAIVSSRFCAARGPAHGAIAARGLNDI